MRKKYRELDIDILGETGRTIQINGDAEIGYVIGTIEEDTTLENIWLSDEDFKRVIWTLKESGVI